MIKFQLNEDNDQEGAGGGIQAGGKGAGSLW